MGDLGLEFYDKTKIKVPGIREMGAQGTTTLELEMDRRTDMILVYDDRGYWLGEIAQENWAEWSDGDRKDVLREMLTWPPCNRGDHDEPNDAGVIEALARLARLVAVG